MAKRIIRVGSRESTLAVAQTRIVMEQIQAHHPELELELVTMKTTGDKILDKALDKIGGKGLFVKELDRALREGRIDISVHSLRICRCRRRRICPSWPTPRGEIPSTAWCCPKA